MLQITSCDAILADMETMLGGFQEGLGAISAEIRGLQQQSSALSCQLNNRTAAQVPLQPRPPSTLSLILCQVSASHAALETIREPLCSVDGT